MNSAMMDSVLAWLLTYSMHSTVLLTLAWFASRRVNMAPYTRDVLWKVALVGGVLTSLAQQRLAPPLASSFALAPTVSSQAPSNEASERAPSAERMTTSPSAATAAVIPNRVDGAAALQRPADATTDAVGSAPAAPAWGWQAIVVIAWASLAGLLAVSYAARRLILIGRFANRRTLVDGPLRNMLDTLCRAVAYNTRVQLTSVNTIASPVALGMNEICVPEAVLTDLEPEQQRSLLAHELAHLTRRDPLWLTVGALLECVFFFQPLNRLARKALQQNAEFLCDDWAATQTGSGLPLAHCLERVAEWMEASPLGVPVAGMAEQRSLLVTRIARLIDSKRPRTVTSRLALGIGAAVLLAATTSAVPGVRRATTDDRGVASQSDAPPDAHDAMSAHDSLGAADPLEAAKSSARPTSRSAVSDGVRDGVSDGVKGGVRSGIRANALRSGDLPEAAQDTAVISALIERLKDSDASVRRAAASSLGNLKSRRAVNALIAAANDRNKDVRNAVIEALAELEDPAALPTFLKALSDESVDVRKHALEGLAPFHDEVRATSLVPLLKDASPDVRREVLERLGDLRERSVITEIIPSLKDGNAEVRRAALEAIKEFDDRSVAPSLVPMLRDADPEVRSAAIEALSELKFAIAESAAAELLADASADVRSTMLEYLKELPIQSLVPTIRKLIDDPNGDVREHAVEALSESRDPAARAALRAALKSEDPKVRRRAAEALGERP